MDAPLTTFLRDPSIEARIKNTLGDTTKTNAFITSVLSVVNSNEALKDCDRSSLLSACLTASSMDLPINQNLGFAYIIPYKGKAQFQMGYKGFIQLAQRSGLFLTISESEVYEGQLVSDDPLLGTTFDWKNRTSDRVIGYVAYFELQNGFKKSLYMDIEQIKKHAQAFSQTFKKGLGVWVDNFDAMAKKTVLKLLLSRYGPMSTTIQEALVKDQAILNEDGVPTYPDNKLPSPMEVDREKEELRIIKAINDSKTKEELEVLTGIVDENSDSNVILSAYQKKLKSLISK